MYALLTGLYRRCASTIIYNILIVGLDNAGKTSFYEQMKRLANPKAATVPLSSLPAPMTIPTVGLNVIKVPVRRGIAFQMWDLGGQSSLRELWESYTEDAHAVLFMIDSSDPQRFVECRTEILRLFDSDVLAKAPLVIVMNKQDVTEAKTPGEVLIALDLPEKITANREVTVLSCVAKQAGGVPEIFEWLVDNVPTSGRSELIELRKARKSTMPESPGSLSMSQFEDDEDEDELESPNNLQGNDNISRDHITTKEVDAGEKKSLIQPGFAKPKKHDVSQLPV